MLIQKYRNDLRTTLLFIILAFIFSCSSRTEYAGIYQTSEVDKEMRSELELKQNGEGYWRVGDSEELFSWYVKGDEIRLNTRKGGVIVAKKQDNTLVIVLSGGKKLSFRKTE